MRLLNAAVAVASALAGTVGATAAYGALNTAPVGHTEPMLEPVTLTHYLPCEPPSKLKDGVCVTRVVKTVVKTAEPIVVTTTQKSRSTKGKASTTAKAPVRDDDDHDGEDEGDHDHEDGED
ncbi:MAG TPA: hypothetical protein VGK17_07315 [Propionicimonas sp.]|jgi:hypothetical protein